MPSLRFIHLLVLRPSILLFYPLPSKFGQRSSRWTSRPYNMVTGDSMVRSLKKLLLHTWEQLKKEMILSKPIFFQLKMVCLFHDVTLDDTTDVADHKEFANRRTCEVEGKFSIIEFEEFTAIASDTDCVVGPTLRLKKNPVLINQHLPGCSLGIFDVQPDLCSPAPLLHIHPTGAKKMSLQQCSRGSTFVNAGSQITSFDRGTTNMGTLSSLTASMTLNLEDSTSIAS